MSDDSLKYTGTPLLWEWLATAARCAANGCRVCERDAERVRAELVCRREIIDDRGVPAASPGARS